MSVSDERPRPPASVREQARSALRPAFSSTVFVNLIQLVQLAVLTHFLTPADIGLASMAAVVVGFVTLFADLGTGSAIIHRRDLEDESLTSLFWLNVVTGALICGALILTVPVWQAMYAEPRLDEPLVWATLTFPVMGFGYAFRALMERELSFGRLAWIDAAAAVVGFAVAVGAGASGAGALAVIWGSLSIAIVRSLLLAIAAWPRWHPGLRFNRVSIRGFIGFGSRLAGQRTVNYLTGNIDFVVVGRFLGPRALGLYSLAYNVANLPSSRINNVLNNVFFPLFARVQDDIDRVRNGFLRLQEFSSVVNFPFAFGVIVAAPIAVPVLLGESWEPAVVLLQVLAAVGLTRSIAGTIGPLLLTRGRTDLGFRWSVLVFCLQVPAIYIGVQTGSALGVAIAFLVVQLVVLVLNYVILVRALIGNCLGVYVASMWPSFWISVVMAAAAGVFPWLWDTPNLAVVVAQVGVGAVVYLALTAYAHPSALTELRSVALGSRAAQ